MTTLDKDELMEKEKQLDELINEGLISKDDHSFKKNYLTYGKGYTRAIHEEILQLDELLAAKTLDQEKYDVKKSETLLKVTISQLPEENQEQLLQLDELIKDNLITKEVYETKRMAIIKKENPFPPASVTSTEVQAVEKEKEKPISSSSSGSLTPPEKEGPKLKGSTAPPAPTGPKVPAAPAAPKVPAAPPAPPAPKGQKVKVEVKKAGKKSLSDSDSEPKIKKSKSSKKDKKGKSKDKKKAKSEDSDSSKGKKKEKSEKKEVSEENYPVELKEKIAQLDLLLNDKVLSQTDYDRKKKQYIDSFLQGADHAKLAKLAQLEELLKDGVLTKEEYDKKRKEIEGPSEKDKAEKIFKYFNKGGTGKLNVKEFQALVFEMGEVFTTEDVKKAIAQIDLDGDGHIDFEEFYSWWTSKSGGDKENQRLHFLQMKLQSESYLRTIKGIAGKLGGVPASFTGEPTGVDATITIGNFKKSQCGIKIRSDSDKIRAGELRRLTGVKEKDTVFFTTVDLKPGTNLHVVRGLLEFLKPKIKNLTHGYIQVNLITTTDKRNQLVISSNLTERSESVSELDIWDHLKIEAEIDFDQTPVNPNPDTIGIQIKTKGTVPRDVIEHYRELLKKNPAARILSLFRFGRFNLKLAPLDTLIPQIVTLDTKDKFKKSKLKKIKKKNEKASPVPVIKGWPSVKEAFNTIGLELFSNYGDYIGIYWQFQSIIEKVSCLGFVIKDTVIDLALHNLNVFDLLPTKSGLGLDNPKPVTMISEDLKLLVFNVYSPSQSVKDLNLGKTPDDSSYSSSSSDEDSSDDERVKPTYKSILVPNFRHWQHKEKGSFDLLFESESRFEISHIIVKTPRFAQYPLRRALFYAYDNDPRINIKDKGSSSSSSSNSSSSDSEKEITWPPQVVPGVVQPFAFVEVPVDKHYVEQKLPQNVCGKFIKVHFIDGWERQKAGDWSRSYLSYFTNKKSKISIEFIGFVGPADPGEIKRDIGYKFGIHH